MKTDKTGAATELIVTAMAQEGSKLRAVCLRKQNDTFEVLWTKSSQAGDVDWRSFAAECGFSTERTGQIETGGDKVAVAGFNSAGVAFYHINVPAVNKDEIAAMVRLQAEARLPLPIEQMELAWQAGRVQDGKVPVTIAAAKREQLQEFVENVRRFKPAKILLDCEGTVKAWTASFSGKERKAVVISIGTRSTQVCLAEFGRLSNAARLDIGIEDFSAAQGPAEQTEAAERLAQDTRSVLELFGYTEPGQLPVFVLSDGDSLIEAIVSCLRSAGLNVRTALPQPLRKVGISTETELGIEDIYEYRVPIGLGLMVLEGDVEELNIFERLYSPTEKEEKRYWLYSPKVAGAIAVVMLALTVFVFYAVDVASEKRLRRVRQSTDFKLLVQQQKLIKTVARQRPNLLKLLNEINSGENSGILLDGLDFKKGQPVKISGQTQNPEQIYKFQESLDSKSSLTEVKIQSTSQDSKTKKWKFTMTFHYPPFTAKKGRI